VTSATLAIVVPTAEAMRDLGAAVGRACRGGDVLILSGDLGAGKTTFTQGLARGIGIEEAVTSPTFVISRVHSNPHGGPGLVHVDAYRLGSSLELDDLDLDADLEDSVVVVEWGGGLAEGLADARLDLVLSRSDDADDEGRTVAIAPHGARWDGALSVEQLAADVAAHGASA
jgi:tRNA threonylcarbamoyladenosine biosynthesis protein TsaE